MFNRIEGGVSALVLLDLGVKPIVKLLLLAKRSLGHCKAFLPFPLPILDRSRREKSEDMSQTPYGALVELKIPGGRALPASKRARLTPGLMALPMVPEPPVPHGLRCVPRIPAEFW